VKRRKFDRLVQEAVEGIPDEFRGYLEDVVVVVQDEPDEDMPEDLLGLYVGTPLTERTHDDTFMMPPQVLIFQGPLEDFCESDEEIVEQVRITVVHEVGHHFGLSDEEIEAVLGP